MRNYVEAYNKPMTLITEVRKLTCNEGEWLRGFRLTHVNVIGNPNPAWLIHAVFSRSTSDGTYRVNGGELKFISGWANDPFFQGYINNEY